MIEPVASNRSLKLLAVVFFVITALVFFDIYGDWSSDGLTLHILIELTIGVISAAAFAWLVVTLKSTREDLITVTKNLQQLSEDSNLWKAGAEKLIIGLADSIDKQLERWGFSKAEKDVALLLLKGLSIKEIASVRSTSEKTVRAQTAAIYSKSGLAGRSELSAFFLEDLLSPASDRT